MTTHDPNDSGAAPEAAESSPESASAVPSTNDFTPPAAEAPAQQAAAPTASAAEGAEAPPPSRAERDEADAAHEEDVEDDGKDEGTEAAPADGAVGEAASDAVPEGESKAKKRRRRRKKKKDEGASAEGAGAEGGEGEGGEGGKKKDRPRREPPAFRVGEEVFGKVERVTDDAIWIDIAGKAQGLFDRRELEGDQEVPGEGDQFVSTVASIGIRGGMVRVSKAPLPLDAAKEKVEKALQASETIEGFVTGAVRGGVEVDVDGLRAFAPASHVDLHPGGDLSHLVGRRFQFNVLSFEKKGRDVVLSRRKFLEQEARAARQAALATIEPNSVQKAIVRAIKAWGVFVALPEHGMVEGLIPREEASHDRATRLEEQFKPGDPIEVRVLRIEDRGGDKKLWLSRKAATDDPWQEVSQKYAVGTRHTGKVARLQPFGAFVELEPGIDGLIHTADISFKPVQHPKDVVKVDDPIDVVVVTLDPSTRKIALHPAPPADEADEPRQRVGPHKQVKVAVVSTSDAGLVVRIIGSTGRHARGFIPASHTGVPRGGDLRKEFPVGTKLEAKVIEVDTRRGEVKLSIRALKEDAEKQAYNAYREGVARDAKFGTFADLMKK
jgi:small subunit ribosomal protein S1